MERSRSGVVFLCNRASCAGGWLVLESWIIPTLYSNNSVPSGKGEWEFCAQLGLQKCTTVLHAHWSSWVQESDIAALAAGGITHVRIPVGYVPPRGLLAGRL